MRIIAIVERWKHEKDDSGIFFQMIQGLIQMIQRLSSIQNDYGLLG